MKQQLFLTAMACVMVFSCCRKDQDSKSVKGDPVITEKGTPTGELHNYTIGPDGGTITSDDGRITLTFPAGAVSATTTVGIQSITNNVPLGLGDGFRLTPEGTTFSKPVTLKINYTTIPLHDARPEFLWITTQNSDSTWSAIHSSEVNTTNKTVTITTTHFSDWALGRFLDLTLEPSSSTLKVGKSLQLHVSGFLSDQVGDSADIRPLKPFGSELAPLDEAGIILDKANTYKDIKVGKWKLNGTEAPVSSTSGALTQEGKFTAPGTIPSINPVAVSVDLEVYNTRGDKTQFSLVSNITIIDADHFLKLVIDGVTMNYGEYITADQQPVDPQNYNYAGASYNAEHDYLNILSGRYLNGAAITDNALNLKIWKPKTGTRQFVCEWDDGNSQDNIWYTKDVNTAFYKTVGYTRTPGLADCIVKDICPDVTVSITKYDDEVEGTISGTLLADTPANKNGCQHSEVHTISGTFKLKVIK